MQVPGLLERFEEEHGDTLHVVDFGSLDDDARGRDAARDHLLLGPLRVVVLVVLKRSVRVRSPAFAYLVEDLDLGRIEPVALLHADVALQERTRGDATSHPLQRNHRTPFRQKLGVANLRHIVSSQS